MKKSGDQFPRKVTTCFRHYKPKLILPLKSVLLYNLPFTLKIVFEKMKLFKMHPIIKLTCPSRQLFIKVKVIFLKSCLLGQVSFMIQCILNNFIFSNMIFRVRGGCTAKRTSRAKSVWVYSV